MSRRISSVLAIGLVVALSAIVGNATTASAESPCPDGKDSVPLTRLADGQCADIRPPTASTLNVIAAKEESAAAYSAYEKGLGSEAEVHDTWDHVQKITGEIDIPRRTASGDVSTFGYVAVVSKQQINSYYCGPATAHTILWSLGPLTSSDYDTVTGAYDSMNGSESHDQPILANWYWLATDAYGGTNWGSPYMPFTLNHWRGSSFYVQAGTPIVGGTLNQTSAAADIDVDTSNGYPVAENILYSSSLSYLPPGFSGGPFWHWDTIYYFDGSTIGIAQPWPYPGAGTRTAYYTRSWSSHWAAIGNGHGIVW